MKKCNVCQETKEDSDFNVKRYKSGFIGLRSYCKKCNHEERVKWRMSSPKDNERNKAYNRTHAVEIMGKKLVKKYWPHLTPTEAIAERLRLYSTQGGACAICSIVPKRLHIDHCHKGTGVRGMLCYNCNNGLGRFKDDTRVLLEAVAYINRHRDKA